MYRDLMNISTGTRLLQELCTSGAHCARLFLQVDLRLPSQTLSVIFSTSKSDCSSCPRYHPEIPDSCKEQATLKGVEDYESISDFSE